jgi:hypothetical protein
MVLGFVLGFVTAYVISAAVVVSWSVWATSSSAESSEARSYKSVEVEMDRLLFDELRCI